MLKRANTSLIYDGLELQNLSRKTQSNNKSMEK